MPTVTELQVNGTKRRVAADAERPLLSVLRDDLDLTGCKYGCGEGRCGACTVLLDGRAIRSCITPVSDAAEKPVRTVEGLAKDGKLHPLQEAFLETGALQCGYCTPGMILSALALLEKTPDPSVEQVIQAMDGNVCRCGVYSRIVLAIRKAAQVMKGGAR